MPPLAPSYIIVGAGIFGASTALFLSRENPAPTVILIDRAPFPCPVAASHDINKIVRSDYGDIFYCKLGLQTQERWREDPLYMQWYHQSALVKATDERFGNVKKIFDNYKQLGVDVKAELISPKELKTRFEGLYAEADFTDVDDLLFNPSSGWHEAASALKATIETAVENGVQYVSSTTGVALASKPKTVALLTPPKLFCRPAHTLPDYLQIVLLYSRKSRSETELQLARFAKRRLISPLSRQRSFRTQRPSSLMQVKFRVWLYP